MSDASEKRGIGQGATALRPKMRRGATPSRPKMRQGATALRPEIGRLLEGGGVIPRFPRR